MKPEELEAFLNDYIVRQGEAKRFWPPRSAPHFNRIRFTEHTKGRNRYDGVGHIKTTF